MSYVSDTVKIFEFIRKYAKYPIRWWRMLRVKCRSIRYWQTKQSKWSISDVGKVIIEHTSMGGYFISLPIVIRYINTDNRYGLDLELEPIMRIFHSGESREGKYYTLTTHNLGGKWVAPSGKCDIKHTFSITVWAQPLLPDSVKCLVKGRITGSRNLPIGVIRGKLKLEGGNVFYTKVGND
jgi:hypothetical protein